MQCTKIAWGSRTGRSPPRRTMLAAPPVTEGKDDEDAPRAAPAPLVTSQCRRQRGRGQEVVQADHFAPASGWPSGSGRCCPGVSSGFGVLDVLRAARGAKERAELAEAHLEARRTN